MCVYFYYHQVLHSINCYSLHNSNMEYHNAIMGPQYCLPYATDLVFSKTIAGVRHGELAVTDVNGKPLFWFDGSSKDNMWFLVDANSSSPLISLKRKKVHVIYLNYYHLFMTFFKFISLSLYIYVCVCVKELELS